LYAKGRKSVTDAKIYDFLHKNCAEKGAWTVENARKFVYNIMSDERGIFCHALRSFRFTVINL